MLLFGENVLWLLVLIGVMIMIHELGHFWAARLFDVKVDVFSFGFGPRLFGFRRGEGVPQLGQRIAADHRRQQQPVGPQRAANLRQHAWKIVDELKGECRDDEIERFGGERESFRRRVLQADAGHGPASIAQQV